MDNYKKGGGSQLDNPTFSNYGKKKFRKCLTGTSRCDGCGNNDHKVRDSPTIATIRRDLKQAPYIGTIVCEQKKNHSYVL